MSKIDLEKDFKGLVHDPDRVLTTIAITALNPTHIRSYRDCCYSTISDGIRDGQLRDDDEIILIGMQIGTKYMSSHGFVVRGEVAIIDSFSGAGTYHPDGLNGKGSYTYDKKPDFEWPVVKRIPFYEFKRVFAPENVEQIPNDVEYPDPVL